MDRNRAAKDRFSMGFQHTAGGLRKTDIDIEKHLRWIDELVMRGTRYNVTNRRRNQNRLKAPRHEKRKASVHEIYGGD